jgi:hypothetical protein
MPIFSPVITDEQQRPPDPASNGTFKARREPAIATVASPTTTGHVIQQRLHLLIQRAHGLRVDLQGSDE